LGGFLVASLTILVTKVVSPTPILMLVGMNAFLYFALTFAKPTAVCAEPDIAPKIALDLYLSYLYSFLMLKYVVVRLIAENAIVPVQYSEPSLPEKVLFGTEICPFKKDELIKTVIIMSLSTRIKLHNGLWVVYAGIKRTPLSART